MVAKSNGVISYVYPGSPGEAAGIRSGDRVMAIGGYPMVDILDYRFMTAADEVELVILSPGSERTRRVRIKKDFDEDLGIEFEQSGLEEIRQCRNKCVFCFVDQLPDGVRDSLKVKDDDYVHSFLNGNYISLTNCTDDDIERIIRLRFSPIYISVHATDPDVRRMIFGNPKASDIMIQLKRLVSSVVVHAQLVLVPGLNDGAVLERSLKDLLSLAPGIASVAAVPVGLTSHRSGLDSIRSFTKEEASEAIGIIESFQTTALERIGTRFAFPSDEFFLKADRAIPEDSYYEEYPQLDNGVGLVRQFKDSFSDALPEIAGLCEKAAGLGMIYQPFGPFTIATGISAYPIISEAVSSIPERAVKLNVVPITNRFFGESVTVAGLLTGSDFIEGLKGIALGKTVIIPDVCIRDGDGIFLDGMDVPTLSDALGVPVRVSQSTGDGFANEIIDILHSEIEGGSTDEHSSGCDSRQT